MSPSRRFRFLLLLSAAGCGLAPAPTCRAQKWAKIDPFTVQGQGYAALDISADSTGGSSVSLLALDDHNQAAFAYTATNGNCVSVVWSQGKPTGVANFPCSVDTTLNGVYPGSNGSADSSFSLPAQHYYSPGFITTDGTVFGSGGYFYLSPGSLLPTWVFGPEFRCAVGAPQPFYLSGPYTASSMVAKVVYGYTLTDGGVGILQNETMTCVASNGDYGGNIFARQCGGLYYYGGVNVACVDVTFFDAYDFWDPSLAPPLTHVAQSFFPTAMNAHDWAIGSGDKSQSQGVSQLWNDDQQQLLSLDAGQSAVALNEQNDVLVGPVSAGGESYLLAKGDPASRRYLLAHGADSGLIPARAQPHLRNLAPQLLSNEAAPPADGSVGPVLYVVFGAQVHQEPDDSPGTAGTFVLRLLSDGTSDLHEVSYPANVFSAGLRSINTSGVLAALTTPGSTGDGSIHALLLVPAEFQAQDGRINYGFDPPMKGVSGTDPFGHAYTVPDDPLGEPAWASVTQGSVSNNVQFVLPKGFAPSTQLKVTVGGDYKGDYMSLVTPPPETALTMDKNLMSISGATATSGSPVETLIAEMDGEIQAQSLDGSQTLSTLKVAVLPAQTVRVGIYRVIDPDSPLTSPLDNAPSDDTILGTLNDVYQQAGVTFVNANKPGDITLPISYDQDVPNDERYKDGLMQSGDEAVIENYFLSQKLPGQIRIAITKGVPSGSPRGDSYSGARVYKSPPFSVVSCYTNSKANTAVDLLIAHEVGHNLGLSVAKAIPQGSHDYGPYPPATTGLMFPGEESQTVLPGKWLRHEDWQEGNKNAIKINQLLP